MLTYMTKYPIHLTEDMHTRLKVVAAELKMPMKTIAQDALEAYLTPLETSIHVERVDRAARVEAEAAEKKQRMDEDVKKLGLDRFAGKSFVGRFNHD